MGISLPSLPSILAPIHLLSYSSLLGAQLYQSFMLTKVAFNSLPRSSFRSLQKRVFTLYFQGQTVLLVLTALTIPPYGPGSLLAAKTTFTPFALAGVTAVLNLLVYGPRTQRLMMERVHQAARDGRKPGEDDEDIEPSLEMQELNRSFRRNHAMSIHLNLLTIGAMMFWGWKLALALKSQ
ncbi:hypothetical protein F5Y15DRAFT_416612 [Xylariaceae sp. FL0016]|nr:hypothetical protein F5Y15DRAFT_416612 [Xylariaceae sp. FL0016]